MTIVRVDEHGSGEVCDIAKRTLLTLANVKEILIIRSAVRQLLLRCVLVNKLVFGRWLLLEYSASVMGLKSMQDEQQKMGFIYRQ